MLPSWRFSLRDVSSALDHVRTIRFASVREYPRQLCDVNDFGAAYDEKAISSQFPIFPNPSVNSSFLSCLSGVKLLDPSFPELKFCVNRGPKSFPLSKMEIWILRKNSTRHNFIWISVYDFSTNCKLYCNLNVHTYNIRKSISVGCITISRFASSLIIKNLFGCTDNGRMTFQSSERNNQPAQIAIYAYYEPWM